MGHPVLYHHSRGDMTYKRLLLCLPEGILFAFILNKCVKDQDPPGDSLASLSILFSDCISDVTSSWMGYQL